jgi:5-methylcytosine-specific restriction protein A
MVWHGGQGKDDMPKKRQPREIWMGTKRRIYERDGGLCQYPLGKHPVTFEESHCDHIKSGKLGTNADENLRTLCKMHHTLRADSRHRGMIAGALKAGVIPPNWRELVWDD